MKHAGSADLDRIAALLQRLRALEGLKEKSHGVFYRGSRAFLHFHAGGDALYADVRLDREFERLPVTKASEQDRLIAIVAKALKR